MSPPTMALSLKPEHLKRYKDVALLLAKHGRADLVKTSGLDAALLDEDLPETTAGDPDSFARDLEALGPTFIKLGQMLSTRPDVLPPAYLDALTRLQDQVAPFSFAEVEQIIQDELGVRLSKAFEKLEAEPLAAASLGQVHRGTLRDGRPVVVKIQRPGIREQIWHDLEALDEVAVFLDTHTEAGRRFGFANMLGEFRKSLLRELDYRQEAQHLIRLSNDLKTYDRLVVPLPVADYTTSRVLTMDYVRGTKITEVSPLTRIELEGEALADDLSKAYLDQILVNGFFHADPHPGNVFLTEPDEEGMRRLALLDLGMVAHLDERMQEHLLKLLLAISEGHGREVADLSIEMGHTLPEFDREGFTRAVVDLTTRFQDAALDDLQVGRIMMEITRIGGTHGLRAAPELTMLGKTLLNLDEVARTLDPTFNPNASIRRHADTIMQRRMLKSLSPGHVFSNMLEMGELIQTLPRRVNTLLNDLVKKEFEIRIKAFDETQVMQQFQHMTNRIAIAVVLAALIVGAALMMRVDTTFTIFGYPGLAMLFFLLAAACGFMLVISIFLSDRRSPES